MIARQPSRERLTKEVLEKWTAVKHWKVGKNTFRREVIVQPCEITSMRYQSIRKARHNPPSATILARNEGKDWLGEYNIKISC